MRDQSLAPNPSHGPSLPSDRQPTHIVGIGASAGGLEALERLFDKMPAETGLAFVVVQHLSPDFKSLTNELLARRTAIPIHRVEDGMPVERDAIYLIPPKKDMIVANGHLLLTDKDPAQLLGLPIDYFFRSLAHDAGEKAIAIVLSGTGSDGSRGIQDVHEAGGLVMVQSSDSAKFDGMPKSALKTGVVDTTLAPEEMPLALLKYIKHPLCPPQEPLIEPVHEGGMAAVFRLLRDAYDIDFSHYKPATVTRRTERRLLLSGAGSLDEYIEQLRNDPEELNSLYKDLLIGVTRFFRDKEAYALLAGIVLPDLVQQVPRDGELRLWVAGCATGEEAYSLAILVQEAMTALNKPVHVKIFATDVHRNSLEMASAGLYSEASLTDVSPERLERFFQRRADGYQVTPELRKMVVFAQHNVLKDAPFTKLDLVSCRNLLIYLQPLGQKKALSLFHFGLKTGGTLFLGPSESPGELEDEFDVTDARWRLYRKRRDVRLPTDIRLGTISAARGTVPGIPAMLPAPGTIDHQLLGTYDALLDLHMPSSLLINENRQVVQTFAGASRYLTVKDGRFSADVLDMVDSELRTALSGALPRAFKDLKPAGYKGLRVRLPDGERLVNVTVKPLENRRTHIVHALVCLEEAEPPPRPEPAPAPEIQAGPTSAEHVLALEAELNYTRENLQATIEELETSNEELQATNEELVAANEELQSTNEELHSVNEELYTVNAEYQKKIGELTELTADMDNLLTSTQVHTIFLDRKLCIRKFTPMIGETFNLLSQDVGRRIDSFTHTIDHPTLLDDLKTVLQTGQQIEKPVQDHKGRWFLLRILPYRMTTAVEGVVFTLVDITNLRRAEAEVHRNEWLLSSVLRTSPHLVSIKDLEGRFIVTDEAFHRLVGRDPTGLRLHDVFPRETAEVLAAQDRRVVAEGREVQTEVVIPHPDGPHTYLSMKFPLRDESGKIVAVSDIKTDVTQLKQAEKQAREALIQRDRFLAMLSHELRNPLAAILNTTAVLEHQETPPAAAEWLHVIERRATHMARLLDDLLEVARVTQNKIEVRRQQFDLTTTVDDTLEEVRPTFQEQHLELTVNRPETPLPVNGDPVRLQQIQVNLLLNAARYTAAGGRIWYAVRREGDRAVIRVRDTGVGIAPEMLERVFDLFVQADKPGNTARGGIGVGLTLVRSLVELHGGRVQAFSDGPGKGSEFVVWLPLAKEDAPAPPVPEAPAKRTGKSPHILIVEDDDDIRASLKAILEMDGYPVRTAEDGPAALAALADASADVALIDIGLPGMDGYELVRRVRARFGAKVPHLVALTGYGQASDREAARAAGFDMHLTKPLKPRELYRLLEKVKNGAADGNGHQ